MVGTSEKNLFIKIMHLIYTSYSFFIQLLFFAGRIMHKNALNILSISMLGRSVNGIGMIDAHDTL